MDFIDEQAAFTDHLLSVWRAGEILREGLQIRPHEARLLQLCVRLHRPMHVLDIGSFVGLSALSMAEALPDGAKVTTIERSREYAAMTRVHIALHPNGDRVEQVRGDALEYLQESDERYDMVFIDAEKRFYDSYLRALLPRLNPHALIVADNTLLRGAVEAGEAQERVSHAALEAMQRFHGMVADASRFQTVTLPTSDGMTLALKL